MDLNLKDRKIVITGAGDGIGRALALAFASAGAKVAGCARGETRLSELSRIITGKGHIFKQADLTKPEEVKKFHGEVIEAFHGADVLVNNVGSVLKFASFFELTDEDWVDSFQVNLLSAVRMSRLFIPALKNSGAPRIINISSVMAARPGGLFPHYSAMKAGLSNFTVSLAHTLAGDNILVNCVSPGPVWSRSWENEAVEIAKKTGQDLPKVQENLRADSGKLALLGRMGVPEDITGLVMFLASDHARWITASDFTVDGGILCDPF